jgi:hypothetical protein
VVGEFAIAKDLSKKSRADRFARVDGKCRDSAVLGEAFGGKLVCDFYLVHCG